MLYRFVSGAGRVGGLGWDCTGPSSADHWTTDGEVYCWNDYQQALSMVPRDVGPRPTRATVAQAWGRTPGGNPVIAPAAALAGDWP